MAHPDDIFADPRTLHIFWATFGAELRPIDLSNPHHIHRVKKAREDLATIGYSEDAVKLFIDECMRPEPLT